MKQEVYELTSKIPAGKVSTYKDIAIAMDSRAYRAVGNILAANPNGPAIPCHRVIKSDGSLGGYFGSMDNTSKMELLKSEGIEFENGKVKDFQKVLFNQF